MALAIGLHIDIGIVVRSLADTLGMAKQEELPLRFHPQFLALLASKRGHKQLEVWDPVATYACPWWLQPDIAAAAIFNSGTISECLMTHRQEQHKAGVFTVNDSRPVPPPILPPTTEDQYRCKTCLLYRVTCGGLQSDLGQIMGFAGTQPIPANAAAVAEIVASLSVRPIAEAQRTTSSADPQVSDDDMPIDGNMFSSDDNPAMDGVPERAHVDQESPGSPDNENLGPIDMFGSPEPPIAVVHPARVDATIPSITAIGLPTAGLVRHPRGNSPSDSDADLDDARSMFGPGSSGLAGDGDTSGNNMFTTDDEGADTTDIHMFSSDNDSDIVAVDMFSEVGTRREPL
ncbi:hypothetical protein HYPSUDRAFT_210153 [Hypholoma sublateritium FD-334 SS-4]|uniref:Uncharacterized protein n=1 Tax=Hypholoma sublateritium (strain FD-334 SS-4) TaxID=945553 RepID=A0A0D2N7L5_HYPSF|nr:hypothetical protein HYPSUDRAFT_210153 [Hypholoma sublateritium FD-334 SS-4]